MKYTIQILLVLICIKLSAGIPTGKLIQGEDIKANGSVQIMEDALNDKAVVVNKDWEPIVKVKSPDKPVAIWVRYKNGPICLKESTKGKQTELKWLWSSPDDWRWSCFGYYQPEKLGDEMIIIAGKSNKPIAIDAIVFSDDKNTTPEKPKSEPNKSKSAEKIDISINWEKQIGEINGNHWSVADYEIYKNPGSEDVNEFISKLKPTFIRLHHADSTETWSDEEKQDWDYEKIEKAFQEAYAYKNSEIMINISDCPKWMNINAKDMTEADQKRIAEYCARLVKHIRIDNKLPIKYWEVLNERDNTFEKADELPKLWNLHNKIAKKMKEVDPTILIGGPAMTWPKPLWVEGFLKTCGENFDFITWHNYAVGDAYDSNKKVFNATDSIAKNSQFFITKAKEMYPDKDFESFLTEYNISWSWETRDERMKTNIGAIFHALTIKKVALTGITGMMVWHIKDNIYGLMGSDGTLHTPAYLFLWGNPWLCGTICQDNTADSNKVELIAIKRDNGKKSLLVINKADHSIIIPSAKSLLNSEKPLVTGEISFDNPKGEIHPLKSQSEINIPGYSLTLISEK